MKRSFAPRMCERQAGRESMSSRCISTSLRSGLPLLPSPSSLRTWACAALTSDDLPMPRAPHSRALFAGSPLANLRVLSMSCSHARSMPLRSCSGWRLTCGTGRNPCGLLCQTKASAAEKSNSVAARGAMRSSAVATRSR